MSDAMDLLARRLDLTFEAIVESFKVTAEKGAAAGFEHLADYLNGCDAIEDGDPEAYEACKARLAKDSVAALRESIAAGVEAEGCSCPEDGPYDFEIYEEGLWVDVPGESEQHQKTCPVALAARIRNGEIG